MEDVGSIGTTLIGERLEALSVEYLSNLTKESRPVSIIVITDGEDRSSGICFYSLYRR